MTALAYKDAAIGAFDDGSYDKHGGITTRRA